MAAHLLDSSRLALSRVEQQAPSALPQEAIPCKAVRRVSTAAHRLLPIQLTACGMLVAICTRYARCSCGVGSCASQSIGV